MTKLIDGIPSVKSVGSSWEVACGVGSVKDNCEQSQFNNHLLQIRLETHLKFKYKIRIRIRIPFVIQVQTLFTSSASSSTISAPLNSSSPTPALINLHNSTVITIYCGKLNWFLTFVASTFLAMSMALPLLHPRWSHRLSISGETSLLPNPAYAKWIQQDQIILSTIISSLSESLMTHIVGHKRLQQ